MEITLTPDLLTRMARLRPSDRKKAWKMIGESEWEKCAKDPLYWLDERRHPWPYAYTLDNHPQYRCKLCVDDLNTHTFSKCKTHLTIFHKIEPANDQETRGYFTELPTTRPFTVFEYMRPIAEVWQVEQFLFVPKSRDMMATWTFVALYTWDTIFHRGRQNIFQSETAAKTGELVKRAYFMWKNQPKFLKDQHKVEFGLGPARSGALRVEGLDSEILGFPQGPDQIRQYHPTGLFLDEAAYQVQAGDAFTAIKPAIQAGGRFTAISSANPGWFQLSCQDSLEAYGQ